MILVAINKDCHYGQMHIYLAFCFSHIFLDLCGDTRRFDFLSPQTEEDRGMPYDFS